MDRPWVLYLLHPITYIKLQFLSWRIRRWLKQFARPRTYISGVDVENGIVTVSADLDDVLLADGRTVWRRDD